MQSKIIWLISFLIGLFLTFYAIIINNFFKNQSKIKEYFVNDTEIDDNIEIDNAEMPLEENKDTIDNDSSMQETDEISNTVENKIGEKPELCYSNYRETNIKQKINDYTIIPFKDDISILINTYNVKNKKIHNTKFKWYNELINNHIYNSDNENNNEWFNISNPVNLIEYTDTINSADLFNVQLSGPPGIKLVKNTNYILNNMSILSIIKINKLDDNVNYNFIELALQTNINNNKDSDGDNIYSWGVISLQFKNISKCKFNIIIRFGDKKYEWNDLDKRILLNKNVLFGIIYDGNKIKVVLDYLFKEFIFGNTLLKIGSNPLVINKYGLINMELFTFVYYNKNLSDIEIDLFIKYNNYYINLLNNRESLVNSLSLCENDKISKINTLQDRINYLNEQIEEKDKLLKNINKQLEYI